MDRMTRYRGGDAIWSDNSKASNIVNAGFFNSNSWLNKIWVKVNGVWKQAVAWVKINGVWKIATPKIKDTIWK